MGSGHGREGGEVSALDDFVQAQIEALSCGNWLFNCECGRCQDRRELQLEHDARRMVDRVGVTTHDLPPEVTAIGDLIAGFPPSIRGRS